MKRVGNKPLLQRHLERIQRSRLIDEVILATTTSPQDEPIVELGRQLGIPVFRGAENDVLGRMASLLREYQVELHTEFLGDSPFSDRKSVV